MVILWIKDIKKPLPAPPEINYIGKTLFFLQLSAQVSELLL